MRTYEIHLALDREGLSEPVHRQEVEAETPEAALHAAADWYRDGADAEPLSFGDALYALVFVGAVCVGSWCMTLTPSGYRYAELTEQPARIRARRSRR